MKKISSFDELREHIEAMTDSQCRAIIHEIAVKAWAELHCTHEMCSFREAIEEEIRGKKALQMLGVKSLLHQNRVGIQAPIRIVR